MRGTHPEQQLDTLTMLGFIILIGIVVNNAILLVHQALNFMRGVGEADSAVRKPLEPRQAIAESVRTQIRPILMTTATSVCGMLPLVVAPGSGSEIYRGLGGVVVGGLSISTVFTLLVVPLMLSLVIDIRTGLSRLFGRQFRERTPHVDTSTQPGRRCNDRRISAQAPRRRLRSIANPPRANSESVAGSGIAPSANVEKPVVVTVIVLASMSRAMTGSISHSPPE